VYTIPSFDVVHVEMHQTREKWYTTEGDKRRYNILIQNSMQSVSCMDGGGSDILSKGMWTKLATRGCMGVLV